MDLALSWPWAVGRLNAPDKIIAPTFCAKQLKLTRQKMGAALASLNEDTLQCRSS
jgi:hypothetical protein